jgi:hypothetical protein
MVTMKFRIESMSQDLPVEPFEIELASGNVVSFVGYNATLKSLTARALLHELCRTADKHIGFIARLETRIENAIKVLRSKPFDAPKSALPYLMDDSRLSLRAYFSTLRDLVDRLETYAGMISDERARNFMLSELDELRKNLAPQLSDYLEMKRISDPALLQRALEVFGKKLEEVSKQADVERDLLLPLDVEIAPPHYILRDKRLRGKSVPPSLAPAAVATALLWKLTLHFFSIPSSARVFVVEEPEEAMTPLQQIAYVETLKALAREMPGENYVVLTTHSPYIAGASDQPSYYFSFENGKFTCEPTTIPPPMAKADALLLLKSVEK